MAETIELKKTPPTWEIRCGDDENLGFFHNGKEFITFTAEGAVYWNGSLIECGEDLIDALSDMIITPHRWA